MIRKPLTAARRTSARATGTLAVTRASADTPAAARARAGGRARRPESCKPAGSPVCSARPSGGTRTSARRPPGPERTSPAPLPEGSGRPEHGGPSPARTVRTATGTSRTRDRLPDGHMYERHVDHGVSGNRLSLLYQLRGPIGFGTRPVFPSHSRGRHRFRRGAKKPAAAFRA